MRSHSVTRLEYREENERDEMPLYPNSAFGSYESAALYAG